MRQTVAPRRRYVLLMMEEPPRILLTDWTWSTLGYRPRRRAPVAPVWVFRSRRQADRVRRSYGRGSWRQMDVVFVT